jgi:hypothetical protein
MIKCQLWPNCAKFSRKPDILKTQIGVHYIVRNSLLLIELMLAAIQMDGLWLLW